MWIEREEQYRGVDSPQQHHNHIRHRHLKLNDLVDFFGVFHSDSPKLARCSQMWLFVTALLMSASLLAITDKMSTPMARSTIGAGLVNIRLFWIVSTFSDRPMQLCLVWLLQMVKRQEISQARQD